VFSLKERLTQSHSTIALSTIPANLPHPSSKSGGARIFYWQSSGTIYISGRDYDLLGHQAFLMIGSPWSRHQR
jgi:hypothetical protein